MIENTYIKKSKSWSEFSSKINLLIENNNKLQAGKIYEKCVQLFLQTDPKYQAALKQVWLLQDVPKSVREKLKLPNADEGIDLIAETNQKSYWAIQAKYKSDKTSTLTRKDLSTFRDLAFNYCKNIEHGLVCSPISHEPKKSNLMNKMGFALINEWEDLDKDNNKGWKNIQKKLGGKAVKPEKFKPKPHQSKAIKEVIKAFKSNSVERGKMIMPCGTGKSLTAFWITRDMKVKNVLVAIPSLSLLQQTLNVWTKEFLANDIQPDYLCVCSDESAGSLEKDEFTAQTYDLGIRTTTNVDEIFSFLKNKNSKFKIIFTTYQSGQSTAKASKKAKFSFDLGIMDEAHKTVGHKLKPMAHLLYEKNIKIKKRLFMTATERVYKGGKENEILSMDDPQDYGNTLYQMTFKQAIDANIVSDYKIVSFNVTNAEYREIIQNNEYIRINKNPKQNDDVTARELATALALRKTFKKLKISKALSFHSSIRRADKFEDLNIQINKDFKKYPTIETYHVSSRQKSSDRVQEMRSFEQSNKSLMTNARCLTEGVDVPAIDCVAFIDSKRSKIDIVQAAGRAMRISKGKKYGYILIPIITNLNDLNSASVDTDFEDLVSVISSLATQDERLIDEIKALTNRTLKKYKSKNIIDVNLNVLKNINSDELQQNLVLKVWNTVSSFSYCRYEDAEKYARSLKLNSQKEWNDFAKTKKKPIDIPYSVATYYSNKGWNGWGKFLGTGRIASIDLEFVDYKTAQEYAEKNKIKTAHQWFNHIKTKKPEGIPANPQVVYEKKGFVGWIEFFKKGVSTKNIKYYSYEKTKKTLKKLKIFSVTDFRNARKKGNLLPKEIPSKLDVYYKKTGDWVSFNSLFDKEIEFLSYIEAKKFVQKHVPKIDSLSSYNKIQKKFSFLPWHPKTFYKDEWKGHGDFFNLKNYISNKDRAANYPDYKIFLKTIKKLNIESYVRYRELLKRGKLPPSFPLKIERAYKEIKNIKYIFRPETNYVSLKEAKRILRKLNIKSIKELEINKEKLKKLRVPLNPVSVYKHRKNENWIGLPDYFGRKSKTTNKNYLDYEEAKKAVSKLNIKNQKEWREYSKSKRPDNIPGAPQKVYKRSGDWINWSNFLGNKNISSHQVEYVSYEKAKTILKSLGISKYSSWRNFCKEGKRPINIPWNPKNKYKKDWISWDDFLGR